jgi:KaiC/GvpD/RAD55 family RecA-like ATPase
MISRIPPELRAALSQGVGFSLLIKGAPGTGKTMLAFEILNEFGGGNAIYLSTRVSVPALYHQFPWMEERAESLSLIDATKLYIPPTAVDEIRYYVPDEAYVKYKARLEAMKGFSGPYSLFNVLYEKVVDAEKPATLVVDSWEAITAEEKEMMMELWKAAINALAQIYSPEYRLNLILIAETTDATPLDYLVDGILELNRITIDYRRAREVVLKKLRGTRIDQHKYGFTLDGGRFRSLPPFERRRVEKPRRVEIVPNTATHLSTGCLELDGILDGGLRKGSTAMIEYGDDLSLLGYHSIIAQMIINCIQQGTHCVKIPSSGWDERRLRRGILPFVKEKDYLNYLTVFEIRRAEQKETRENVKVLEGLSMDEDFPRFTEFVSHLEPPVMVIIGTDWLEYQYRLKTLGNLEEALEAFAYWIMELREVGNIAVFGMPTGGVVGSGLGQMVTTHLNLTVLDRSVVLYCNRPDTKLHCLENVITEDALTLQLTPFV